MKSFQKFILPLLIVVIIFLIYTLYFAKEGLGAFSDFDPNNTANKDIIVSVVKEKQIEQNAAAGSTTFYAVDRNGTEYPVQAPYPLPEGIENSEAVSIKGHLHKDYFHAVEVIIK